MFDIGFWEIVLISVIGLVVLGPQRLPIAIRTVLKWVNTAKSMANSVKNEISQELELHEMNENMIKATKQGLKELDPNLKASIDEMKSNVESLTRPYKNNVDDLMKEKSPANNKSADAKLDQAVLNEPSENSANDQEQITPKSPIDQTSQQEK